MFVVEVKVSKTKNGIELSGALPSELAGSDSLEVFALRDGIYLLSIRGRIDAAASRQRQDAQPELSGKEKEVVRKLLSIRFEKRTPAEVAKLLSKDEKELLDLLAKKKLVHVFHGGKYEKDGVYNVSDFAFNAVREPPANGGAAAPAPIAMPASSPEHLEKHGWMVLESDMEARGFGNAFPEKVKSGEVRGMRAFDRKYYFIKKSFAEEWERKVQLALGKGEKTAEELSSELGMAPEGCRALLFHLCESGEAMEKRRGKFSRA